VSGELTAELQALGRPEVQLALDQAGQDVQIQRPGQPDEGVRAILYQLESKGARGQKGTDVEYGSLAWQGIFNHLAPIRTPGYTVVDATGRVFVPEAEAEDPAQQGVALIVRLLPLVDRTRLYTLMFPGPPTLGTLPGSSNPVELPGTSLTISVRLEATADPRLRETVGADQVALALVGRWGTYEQPLTRPTSVRWGVTSPLTFEGQPGVLTMALAWPDSDLATERQFGGRFLATWRSA